jgi:hypothetical protein
MTDSNIGAGPAYSSGTSEFTSGVRWVFVAQSLVFCALLCRSLFVLLSFLRWPLHCLSYHLRHLITHLVFTSSSGITLYLKIKFIGIQNNKCYDDRWADSCKVDVQLKSFKNIRYLHFYYHSYSISMALSLCLNMIMIAIYYLILSFKASTLTNYRVINVKWPWIEKAKEWKS